MSGSMTGRVALVTGAASRIGRAAAEAFAREGARVVVSDVTADAGEAVAAAIRAAGGQAVFVECDVYRPEQVEALVRRTVQAFGDWISRSTTRGWRAGRRPPPSARRRTGTG